MSKKKPKMDVTKAVGRELYQQDQEAKEAKAGRGKMGRGGKKGGKASTGCSICLGIRFGLFHYTGARL